MWDFVLGPRWEDIATPDRDWAPNGREGPRYTPRGSGLFGDSIKNVGKAGFLDYYWEQKPFVTGKKKVSHNEGVVGSCCKCKGINQSTALGKPTVCRTCKFPLQSTKRVMKDYKNNDKLHRKGRGYFRCILCLRDRYDQKGYGPEELICYKCTDLKVREEEGVNDLNDRYDKLEVTQVPQPGRLRPKSGIKRREMVMNRLDKSLFGMTLPKLDPLDGGQIEQREHDEKKRIRKEKLRGTYKPPPAPTNHLPISYKDFGLLKMAEDKRKRELKKGIVRPGTTQSMAHEPENADEDIGGKTSRTRAASVEPRTKTKLPKSKLETWNRVNPCYFGDPTPSNYLDEYQYAVDPTCYSAEFHRTAAQETHFAEHALKLGCPLFGKGAR